MSAKEAARLIAPPAIIPGSLLLKQQFDSGNAERIDESAEDDVLPAYAERDLRGEQQALGDCEALDCKNRVMAHRHCQSCRRAIWQFQGFAADASNKVFNAPTKPVLGDA